MKADEGAWRAPHHSRDPYPVDSGQAGTVDHSQFGGVDVVETWPGRQAPERPRTAEPPAGSPSAPGEGGGAGEGGGDPPAGGGRRTRRGRGTHGRPGDPRWVRPALVALLAGTAVLYLWGLGASGYGNSFYAAAVQAGTRSWKAFFFGSLDSSNYITVDKPPASLWMMALSGRIFGFSSWSMLVPNALCGVASVGLLFATVRRVAGPAMGLVAGVLLALTPVAVLMFRFNNPDALLVLLLVLSAYCVTRAVEVASWRWITVAGIVLGFAFLTKMMQAFLVVPAFAIAYLIAAPTGIRARIVHVLASGLGIIGGAGWWVLVTILWPAGSRPFIGGSGNNSVLGLAFGYNGLGRIFGNNGNPGGGSRPGGQAAEALSSLGGYGATTAGGRGTFMVPGGAPGQAAEGFPGGTAARAGGFGGSTGITRMFSDNFGAQISWLLPAALILLAGGLWVTRRAPRTDRTRAALLIWGGWTVVTALVFSFMKGIIHEYYSVALAPGIAGTVAIGVWALWRTREQPVGRVFLAVSCGVTSVWSFELLGRTDWQSWLRYPVLLAGLLAAVLLLSWSRLSTRNDNVDTPVPGSGGTTPLRRRLAIVALVAAFFGALGAPAAYALETASTPHTGATPLAGPASARGGFGGPGGRDFPGLIQDGSGTTGAGQTGPETGAFPGGVRGGPSGFGGSGAPGGQSTEMPGQTTGNGQPPTGTELSSGGGTDTATEGQTGATGGFGRGMDVEANSALVKALKTNAGLYRWVAAVSSAQSAASLELAGGGRPVMAMGGFSGSDDAITLAQFQKYVFDGKIHYYIGGGGGPGGGSGGNDIGKITSWVESHYQKATIGGETVYDLTKPVSSSTTTS
jgi:4-amino-4-deoxy-L-arabinose transferase-like glycosyltransferase